MAERASGAGSARLSRARKLTFTALLLVAALAAAEAGVRAFFSLDMPPILNGSSARYGEKTRPDLHGTYRGPEFSYSYTTDGRGYRVVPGTGRPGAALLCVGDSFTFGVGVNDGETFAAVLQRRLDSMSPPGPRFDVVNTGTCGWGTAQELAFFEDDWRALAPAYTVLAVCGNDLDDSVMSGLYSLEGGDLVRGAPRSTPRLRLKKLLGSIPGYDVAASRSHLLALVRTAVSARLEVRSRRDAARRGEEPAPTSGPKEGVALVAAMIGRLQVLSSGRLLVVLVSDPEVLRGARPQGFMADLKAALEAGAAPERRFNLLDANDLFKARGITADEAHFPIDRHWTALAHRLVGEELAARLPGSTAGVGPR